jgi:hypothetical protein
MRRADLQSGVGVRVEASSGLLLIAVPDGAGSGEGKEGKWGKKRGPCR